MNLIFFLIKSIVGIYVYKNLPIIYMGIVLLF